MKEIIETIARCGVSESEREFVRKTFEIAGEEPAKYFLDTENFALPIFEPYLAETVALFNAGLLKNKYSAEELDTYGRALARIMTKSVTVQQSKTEFDEDGNVTSSEYDSDTDSIVTYVYQDGLVVRKNNKYGFYDNTQVEYGQKGSEEEAGLGQSSGDGVDLGGEEDSGDHVVEVVEEVVSVTDERFTIEEVESREFSGKEKRVNRLYGNFLKFEEKNGRLRFEVPLFKIGEVTANGNRYTMKCAKNLIKDLKSLTESGTLEGKDKKSLDIVARFNEYNQGRIPDMLATHGARFGQGNPLLEKCGKIIGGRIDKIEGDDTFILIGETIGTNAGKDLAVLIKEGMVRGVSLVGLPVDKEPNEDGGDDVDRLHLVGTDFTDDGANLIQFKDKTKAGFTILN